MYSQEFRIRVFQDACNSSVQDCTNFNTLMEFSNLQLFMMNNYFDSSDLDNPVKNFIDDRLVREINLGSNFVVNIPVRKNKYKINNSLLPFFSTGSYEEFYSFGEIQQSDQRYPNLENGEILGIFELDVDPNIYMYEVTLPNICDILALAGGFALFVYLVLGGICQCIGQFLYQNEVTKGEVVKNGNWFSFPPIDIKKKEKAERVRPSPMVPNRYIRELRGEEEKKENNRINSYRLDNEEGNDVNEGDPLTSLKAKERIKDYENFQKSLDSANISQSIQELKHYVSYLLNKDNSIKINDNENIHNPSSRPNNEAVNNSLLPLMNMNAITNILPKSGQNSRLDPGRQNNNQELSSVGSHGNAPNHLLPSNINARRIGSHQIQQRPREEL